MPDAPSRSQRILLLSLTSSFVTIVCALASAPSHLQDGNKEANPVELSARLRRHDQQSSLAPLVNYLVWNGTYSTLAERKSGADAHLLSILHGVGPDMKPASAFMDPRNITLDVTLRAWQLMHNHAEHYAGQRVDLMWPIVREALVEANVSNKCLIASERLATGARELKTWAIQLLNSWGTFPPVGLFEGTLGDIGSFHACLAVPANEQIRHAHYCSFSFRPVLPTRKDYELIIAKEPRALLELFNGTDSFGELASKSHYNHYVYAKMGTCLPIDCSPPDAQKIARLLARRAILMSGPVKCQTKFEDDYTGEESQVNGKALQISSQDLNDGIYIYKPHINRSQAVALICLGVLGAMILSFTLADFILNRLPKMCSDSTGPSSEERATHKHESNVVVANDHELKLGTLTVIHHDDNGEPTASQPLATADFTQATEETAEMVGQDENHNNRSLKNDQPTTANNNNNNNAQQQQQQQRKSCETTRARQQSRVEKKKSLLRQLVHDCSLITNTEEFFHISQQQLRSDILCMNGLRCITMSWIILAHTIQYNDWTGFGRIYEIENHLQSLMNQPIFNGSYLVDTFFVMSGLLTSYTVFKTNRSSKTTALRSNFSAKTYLIGRYLRLTPQIMLVALLFILLPLFKSTSGPHWSSMTIEYSENCVNNWWISLFHLQAFYKTGEMCNFVCWWISVDMFYHVVALAVILIILRVGARAVIVLCSSLVVFNGLIQTAIHYRLGLPPNMLSTIPQTGAMWSDMTLTYFWRPNAHVVPFVLGFALGFFIARNNRTISSWFTRRRAMVGWLLAIASYIFVLFGTHCWVLGHCHYSQEVSTAWAIGAQIVWAACTAWTIVACQYGYGGFINRMLSCKFFLVLGKASYFVYLSHFLVVFSIYGCQNFLLEPTQIMIIYIILGNICLSMTFGSILCVTFEMPWLKIQKRIMRLID